MARPQKNGIDYFPLDVDIFDNDKLFDVQQEYGPLGEVIYLRLLCLIYKNGYYYKFDSLDKLASILIKSIGNRWARDKNAVKQVIPFLAKSNLFSLELMRENVLTSESIQRRFLKATERRLQNISDYWLLDGANGLLKASVSGVTVCNNEVNVYNNDVIAVNNSTKESKVNKSKVNKSKVNKSKVNESKVNESKVNPACDKVNGIYQKFNTICTRLNHVNNLPNPNRERAVMYLIDHYTDEQITTAFEQANNSDFLCNNKNGYTFGFDWIVKVENFVKVLEGNYQNKDTIAGKTSSYDLKEVEEMMHNNLPKWQ